MLGKLGIWIKLSFCEMPRKKRLQISNTQRAIFFIVMKGPLKLKIASLKNSLEKNNKNMQYLKSNKYFLSWPDVDRHPPWSPLSWPFGLFFPLFLQHLHGTFSLLLKHIPLNAWYSFLISYNLAEDDDQYIGFIGSNLGLAQNCII